MQWPDPWGQCPRPGIALARPCPKTVRYPGQSPCTATARPQLSEGQSHFAVSQFNVPDTRRARWFVRHRLPRLFRCCIEPAAGNRLGNRADPTQRTAIVGERRHSVAGVCPACRCPVARGGDIRAIPAIALARPNLTAPPLPLVCRGSDSRAPLHFITHAVNPMTDAFRHSRDCRSNMYFLWRALLL